MKMQLFIQKVQYSQLTNQQECVTQEAFIKAGDVWEQDHGNFITMDYSCLVVIEAKCKFLFTYLLLDVYCPPTH